MNDIALVTGTSSGMGLHAAIALAERGLHVVATMRDPSRAGALRDAAAGAGVEVDVRALDVVDRSAATRLVTEVEADHGRIDVLANNAGRGSVATAEQLTMQQIQDQLDVNYLAPVHLTKLVLPGMRERGRGRILTVTSVGGTVGQPFADAYCGAKFAVEGFMQSLAVVAERFGVRVGVIEPAAVASSFVSNAVLPESGGGRTGSSSTPMSPAPRGRSRTRRRPSPQARLSRTRSWPTNTDSAGRARRARRRSRAPRLPTWTGAGYSGSRVPGSPRPERATRASLTPAASVRACAPTPAAARG